MLTKLIKKQAQLTFEQEIIYQIMQGLWDNGARTNNSQLYRLMGIAMRINTHSLLFTKSRINKLFIIGETI
jgi:hypothetical protein